MRPMKYEHQDLTALRTRSRTRVVELRDQVAALEEQLRQAVRDAAGSGLSYVELGDLLQVSRSTLWRHYVRDVAPAS